MSTSAIIMLIVAAAIVWGGLTASVVFIRRNPEVTDLRDPEDDSGGQPTQT